MISSAPPQREKSACRIFTSFRSAASAPPRAGSAPGRRESSPPRGRSGSSPNGPHATPSPPRAKRVAGRDGVGGVLVVDGAARKRAPTPDPSPCAARGGGETFLAASSQNRKI